MIEQQKSGVTWRYSLVVKVNQQRLQVVDFIRFLLSWQKGQYPTRRTHILHRTKLVSLHISQKFSNFPYSFPYQLLAPFAAIGKYTVVDYLKTNKIKWCD